MEKKTNENTNNEIYTNTYDTNTKPLSDGNRITVTTDAVGRGVGEVPD